MRTVPTSETVRMNAVFAKPSSIFPSVNAVT